MKHPCLSCSRGLLAGLRWSHPYSSPLTPDSEHAKAAVPFRGAKRPWHAVPESAREIFAKQSSVATLRHTRHASFRYESPTLSGDD